MMQKTADENRVEYETPHALLLAPYIIIPITLLIALFSYLHAGSRTAFDAYAAPVMLLYLAVFNLPHIVASGVTLFDAQYIKTYGWKIFLPAVLLLIAVLPFHLPSHNSRFILCLMLATNIHIFGQQFGLVRMFGMPYNKMHSLWKWVTIFMFGLGLLSLNLPDVLTPAMRLSLQITGEIAAAVFCAVSCFIYASAPTASARLYVLAVAVSVLWTGWLYQMGYLFLVTVVPRFIHDVTAFIIYIYHDMNRNSGGARNMVYRAFSFSRIPVYILGPLLAFALALPVTWLYFFKDDQWAYKLFIFLTLMHYYTESFAWKKGGLQREYIRVS